jgi:hypothetical protein
LRWFKHFTDARHNPKLRRIEDELGEAGYARACKLLEIVGERGGSGEKFNPRIDLKSSPTDLRWLACELKIPEEEARTTLNLFASVRLIDPKSWRRMIVYVPQMKAYVDEWTQRRQRGSHSGVSPELLPRDSGKSKKSESESDPKSETEINGESKLDEEHSQTNYPAFSSPTKSVYPDVTSNHPIIDPWTFLGINRKKVPRRFLADASQDGCDRNFEWRLRAWAQLYLMECKKTSQESLPSMFAEFVLRSCQEKRIEYPAVLLRRKKELEGMENRADSLDKRRRW